MKNTGKPPRKTSRSASGKPSGPRGGGKPTRGEQTGKPQGKIFRGRDSAKSDARQEGKRPGKPDSRSRDSASDKPFRKDFKSDGSKSRSAAPEHDRPSSRPTRDSARGSNRDAPRDTGRAAFGDRTRPSRRVDRDTDARPPREARTREPRVPKESKSSLGPRANMFGLHAVREAWLNPKRSIHAIYLTEATEAQFAIVMEQADRKGLGRPEPKILDKDQFERLLGRDVVHQGAALSAAPLEESFIQDIISAGADKPRSVVLLLDQVTDPHNVGAILRSACAFGADGVVMQRRHAPELDGIVAKTASGAAEHIQVAYETNLSRTLEELADAGYTAIGLDEHADKTLSEITIPDKCVLILGAEGDGMRRLIKEHCDVLVTLPTRAPIASLNVSNAAAVALYALING